MPTPLPDDVRRAMTAKNKIEAIRLLREHTGLGLAAAKAAVEAGSLSDTPRSVDLSGDLPADVTAAIAAGNKIEAIKLLRETSGMGLKEAKDRVDRASRGSLPGPHGALLRERRDEASRSRS